MNRDGLTATLARRVARDPQLRLLRETVRASGAVAYLVGGPVRDAALGRPCKDADLTVTRRMGALVAAIGHRLGTRGFRFRKRGVTTWRFAAATGEIDVVDAVRRGLEGDLRRRELTINAIAYDLGSGSLEDPLDGLRDLRARRLRAPHADAFHDDPARCLRAARFLAELPGFHVGRETRRQLRAASSGLRRVAAERVRVELDKLLGGGRPHEGLTAIRDWGLLEPLLPELVPMLECAAGHGRPDVWCHTIRTIETSATRSRLPSHRAVRERGELALLRWTLLLHDIAKPATYVVGPQGKPSFHGHEELGAKMAERVLERLRVDTRTRRRIARLIRFHLRPGHLADAGAPARGMRRLARDAGEDLPLLCLHAACDALGSGATGGGRRWRRMSRVLRRLPEVQARLRTLPTAPLLSGEDVMRATGFPAGPRIGRLLRELADARDDGLISTRRQALAYLERLR